MRFEYAEYGQNFITCPWLPRAITNRKFDFLQIGFERFRFPPARPEDRGHELETLVDRVLRELTRIDERIPPCHDVTAANVAEESEFAMREKRTPMPLCLLDRARCMTAGTNPAIPCPLERMRAGIGYGRC